MPPEGSVLQLEHLSVDFATERGWLRAVQDVSFAIGRGELVGLVGESGSGKSTVAHAVLRLLPRSATARGAVRFEGKDVLAMSKDDLRRYRWEDVSLVMQGAMNALNPVMTIEKQVIDVIRSHREVDRRDARQEVVRLLELVGIDPARARSYPHELSGGMRQRCVIAIALALGPSLVVMDEPTTALDVVVQRAIMDELDELRKALGFSVLLISHDLELVAERASKLAIMYAGRIVEWGTADEVVNAPRHPYTEALLTASIPLSGPVSRLDELAGRPPDLTLVETGCPFFPRCGRAQPGHDRQVPLLQEVGPGHTVACHLYKSVGASS